MSNLHAGQVQETLFVIWRRPVCGRVIHNGLDRTVHSVHKPAQFPGAGVFRPQRCGYYMGVPGATYRNPARTDIDHLRAERQDFFCECQTAVENDLIVRELPVTAGPDGLADMQSIHDPQIVFGNGKFSVFKNIRQRLLRGFFINSIFYAGT